MRKLETSSSSKRDTDKHQAKARKSKPKSILEAFEYIVELAEGSNLDDEFFDKASTHINYAAEKLNLSPVQTALLSIFVDRSEDSTILLSEIAEYTGCRTTKMLRLFDEVDVLESKHYIKAARGRQKLSYRVPIEVLASLRSNSPYEYLPQAITDTQVFFDRFDELMEDKQRYELSHNDLVELTREMLSEIKDSLFAKELNLYGLGCEDLLIFVYMAHLFVENNDNHVMFHNIEEIYDHGRIPPKTKRDLSSGSSILSRHTLIENVNEDGIARSDAFKLTDKAKNEILCELNLKNIGKSENGLIKADSLAEKELIYNDVEQAQIAELSSILSQERFADVQRRLSEAGMRKGFCCLFYGAPGTGKTETVYQLARMTGRSIMRVDVDKIKSCWVGESEKNIKSLFDRYRSICKNAELAPILLFNEADAVLGVRMEGAARAVDKMENSIQNIILQEMESLDGIMIATTNLTTNLDKAFERRFLYKVRFEKPTVEARSLIWQCMLGGLTSEQANALAVKFDLSGGEIENIARKHTVQAILSGEDTIDLDKIIETCSQERISQGIAKRIGF